MWGLNVFARKPKAESAIVRLTPHTELPFKAQSQEALELVVRTAFSQRRKTPAQCPKLVFNDQQLEDAGLNPNLRPENISLAQYVQLANRYVDIHGDRMISEPDGSE